jgi:hypothetical protein
VALRSDDGATHVSVDACVTDALPTGSVFGSVQAASDFFEAGSLGYSATPKEGQYVCRCTYSCTLLCRYSCIPSDKPYQSIVTLYQVRADLFREYLRAELRNPRICAL